jgi:hypothetical protein
MGGKLKLLLITNIQKCTAKDWSASLYDKIMVLSTPAFLSYPRKNTVYGTKNSLRSLSVQPSEVLRISEKNPRCASFFFATSKSLSALVVTL